jgi:hypothetical protein
MRGRNVVEEGEGESGVGDWAVSAMLCIQMLQHTALVRYECDRASSSPCTICRKITQQLCFRFDFIEHLTARETYIHIKAYVKR